MLTESEAHSRVEECRQRKIATTKKALKKLETMAVKIVTSLSRHDGE